MRLSQLLNVMGEFDDLALYCKCSDGHVRCVCRVPFYSAICNDIVIPYLTNHVKFCYPDFYNEDMIVLNVVVEVI